MRKLLILLPDGKIHKVSLPFLTMSFREAPLTGTMLAALTPSDLVNAARRICRAGSLVFSLHSYDPLARVASRFGGWRYRSDFFTVEFDGRRRALRGVPHIEVGAL